MDVAAGAAVVQLILELEPGVQPIRGVLVVPGRREPQAFQGWIELAGMIEAARTAGPDGDTGTGDGAAPGPPSESWQTQTTTEPTRERE